jgi:hypothetical protein
VSDAVTCSEQHCNSILFDEISAGQGSRGWYSGQIIRIGDVKNNLKGNHV